MVTKLGPLCRVKLLKNDGDKLVVRSPEKAGRRGFNSLPGHHTCFVVNRLRSSTYLIQDVPIDQLKATEPGLGSLTHTL